eukprot:7853426-Ditylum_brightwellii.AAC.1
MGLCAALLEASVTPQTIRLPQGNPARLQKTDTCCRFEGQHTWHIHPWEPNLLPLPWQNIS